MDFIDTLERQKAEGIRQKLNLRFKNKRYEIGKVEVCFGSDPGDIVQF
jgi:hypothetical protein